MSVSSGKRFTMTMFSDPASIHCHKVRLVLAEKAAVVEMVQLKQGECSQEVAEINPYNDTPTLLDRDLVLYGDPKIMMEYLDERFPHPPLLPVYPVARAQSRLWMYRIEKDWYSLVDMIEQANMINDEKKRDEACEELKLSIYSVAPIFDEKPFFFSDEFTLVDCCLAPLFWRLPLWGIDLAEKKAKALREYCDRIFSRDAFIASLSETERSFDR